MKTKTLLTCIFLLSLLLVKAQTNSIYINEVLASNETIVTDPDFNEYSDLIELYNATESPINLNGYFLSDDLSEPLKWKFTSDIMLNGKQHLVIWCDNKDIIAQGVHTNFKLSQDGEEIALYSADSSLIDSLLFTAQETDISWGRNPSDANVLEFYDTPTPGEENSMEGYQVSATPELSLPAGYYEDNQLLYILSKGSMATIRYTLDGTDPTILSEIFPDTLVLTDQSLSPNTISEIRTNRDPFNWLPEWVPPEGNIFKANVVKVRSFEPGKRASAIVTNTYFVTDGMPDRYNLPIISIVTDPDSLFDFNTGIYVPGIHHINGNSWTGNYFQDWEKEVHISYFDAAGNLGFSQNVGVRIQGGTSPASPQKSFHVIARNKYGDSRIDYPIFQETNGHARDIQKYKRFILRAWGSTILSAKFNDAFAHRLVEESALDIQAYQPVILFINGEYWGLHELREANKSKWYYDVHHNIDEDEPGIDLIYHWDSRTAHNPEANEGDLIQWNSFTDYIHSHDLSDQVHYEYIKTQLDIDNFINYMAHSLFLGKWDWPGNNEASWRPRNTDGKWRYITFDMEASFGIVTELSDDLAFLGPEFNMFDHVITGTNIPGFDFFGPHLVFKELIKNQEFVYAFVTSMESKLDNEFSPVTTTSVLDEMVSQIEPYIQENNHRWPFVSDIISIDWNASIDGIRDYLEQRPDFVREHLEVFKANYLTGVDNPGKADPANDFLQSIKYLSDNQIITSQLYTLDGRLYQQNLFSKEEFISYINSLDYIHLPVGIFLHTVIVENNIISRKLYNVSH